MHCCKSWTTDLRQWVLGCLAALVLWMVAPGVHAQGVQVKSFDLTHESDGLFLSAQLGISLSSAMVDALNKGVPLYFVATAQVVKERWYWRDAVLVQTSRHMRLVYQPLTRRWRLNASSSPLASSGLGVSLSQNFPVLEDAVNAMGRFAHWQVASSDQLARLEGQNVQFTFEIDSKQLPRPFVIGQAGNADWALSTSFIEPFPAKAQP